MNQQRKREQTVGSADASKLEEIQGEASKVHGWMVERRLDRPNSGEECQARIDRFQIQGLRKRLEQHGREADDA